MATKIERIHREIAKTREKIAEYQEKLKTLEAQKTEAENLEAVKKILADRKSTRLNSSHTDSTRMPSSA